MEGEIPLFATFASKGTCKGPECSLGHLRQLCWCLSKEYFCPKCCSSVVDMLALQCLLLPHSYWYLLAPSNAVSTRRKPPAAPGSRLGVRRELGVTHFGAAQHEAGGPSGGAAANRSFRHGKGIKQLLKHRDLKQKGALYKRRRRTSCKKNNSGEKVSLKHSLRQGSRLQRRVLGPYRH